jgi:nucleoside-diphosphate-sugar epimerase
MKVIISGSNGFVGNTLTKLLLDKNNYVVAIDVHSESKVKHQNLKYISMSIGDIDKLKTILNNDFDLFYHFAWKGTAGDLRSDIDTQITNALWTFSAMKVAKELGCKKFIVAGTIMEQEALEAVYTDNTRPSVNYIYGAGKILSHLVCKPYANQIGIDLVWAYITNAYGIGEISPRFINSTLRKIIQNEKLVFSSGTQNYDFIYIDDVANAFYLLGLKGEANKSYTIGSSKAKPLKDFILEIKKTLAPNKDFIFGEVPFSGVNLSLKSFDTTTMNNEIGFYPSVSFEEGIRKTYNWIKEGSLNE